MSNPPAAKDITPQWLTERLQAQGHAGVEVTQVKPSRIGTGQVGICLLLELTLTGQTEGVPTSLVAKLPSDDELSKTSAVAMGIYEREVMFYRDLAPRLHIALPKIYYSDVAANGADFLILMENLAPAVPGDQLVGCSPEVARAAVLELVGLQAPTWNDVALAERLVEPADGFFSDMHALYNEMLPGFVERFGPRLGKAELGIIQGLGAHKNAPLFQATGTPFCLEHRDYRLDNLMIDELCSPPKVVVVDWQGLRIGRPLNDVALCLAGGLQPQQRAAAEEEILREYHQGLLAAGVRDFSWEACWHEYRRASFAGFGLTIISSMLVVQTPRGDDMFTAMAQRYSRHALDLAADELFT